MSRHRFDEDGHALEDEDVVDWGKVEVSSRASESHPKHPLGDAARWGGYVEQRILPPRTERSDTIVRAQTHDMYSRTWTALGTLKAPDELWELPDDEWLPLLEISMGVGQNTVIHMVNLRNVCALDATVYQPVLQGGYTTRPWVMGGGILAVALNIRMVNILLADLSEQVVTTAMQIAPIMAGTGL